MSSPHISRPRVRGRPRPVALGVTVLLVMILPVLVVESPAVRTAASGGSLVPFGTGCPATTYSHRAAREVSLSSPTQLLGKGDVLRATYEFRVVATSLHPLRARVNAPSLFAKFPERNGAVISLYLGPRAFVLTSTNWTAASSATASTTLTGPTAFSSSSSAVMTSELLGIMATAPLGALTLAFRWHWEVTFALNGSTQVGPWSALTKTGPTPTIFDPAPYVKLASTSSSTTQIGKDFTANLLGAVANTVFHSEFEYASTGIVVGTTPTVTGPGNSTAKAVPVLVLGQDGRLAPATMLDHVRNNCGALTYSITVHAVYAPSATVTFAVTPVGCGPITFNGTSRTTGSTATLKPSPSTYPISAPTCSGHAFHGWVRSGGVFVNASSGRTTWVVVSASGKLTATYT